MSPGLYIPRQLPHGWISPSRPYPDGNSVEFEQGVWREGLFAPAEEPLRLEVHTPAILVANVITSTWNSRSNGGHWQEAKEGIPDQCEWFQRDVVWFMIGLFPCLYGGVYYFGRDRRPAMRGS